MVAKLVPTGRGKSAAKRSVVPPRPVQTQPRKALTTVRFFVADDVRQETGGKVTVVGLFADNVVVVELPEEAPDPTPERMAQLQGITVLANVSAGAGPHDVQFEIDPSSILPTVAAPITSWVTTAQQGESINLVMRLAPLPFTRFGMVNLTLRINGDTHAFSFEIRRGNGQGGKSASASEGPRRKASNRS